MQIHLVPAHVAYKLDVRQRQKANDVEIRFAFRDPAGREPHVRSLIRSIVHESTHLSDTFARLQAGAIEREVRASLMETCVEAAVFGNSHGYAFPAEIDWSSEGYSPSQKRSIEAAKAAYRDVKPFIEQSDWEGLDALCRERFSEPIQKQRWPPGGGRRRERRLMRSSALTC